MKTLTPNDLTLFGVVAFAIFLFSEFLGIYLGGIDGLYILILATALVASAFVWNLLSTRSKLPTVVFIVLLLSIGALIFLTSFNCSSRCLNEETQAIVDQRRAALEEDLVNEGKQEQRTVETKSNETATVQGQQVPFNVSADLDTTTWNYYSNSYYGFSIKYPKYFALNASPQANQEGSFHIRIYSLGEADPPSFDISIRSIVATTQIELEEGVTKSSSECDNEEFNCVKATYARKSVGGFDGLLVKVPGNYFADWEAFYFITSKGVLRFSGSDVFSYTASRPWIGDEIISTIEKL